MPNISKFHYAEMHKITSQTNAIVNSIKCGKPSNVLAPRNLIWEIKQNEIIAAVGVF